MIIIFRNDNPNKKKVGHCKTLSFIVGLFKCTSVNLHLYLPICLIWDPFNREIPDYLLYINFPTIFSFPNVEWLLHAGYDLHDNLLEQSNNFDRFGCILNDKYLVFVSLHFLIYITSMAF